MLRETLNNDCMQSIFEIDANRRTPKYLQIVHSVTKAIKQGRFKKGDRIYSINELSNEFLLSKHINFREAEEESSRLWTIRHEDDADKERQKKWKEDMKQDEPRQ